MPVGAFREWLANEFDVGESRPQKVDALVQQMDDYDQWQDKEAGGVWVIGLMADFPDQV